MTPDTIKVVRPVLFVVLKVSFAASAILGAIVVVLAVVLVSEFTQIPPLPIVKVQVPPLCVIE